MNASPISPNPVYTANLNALKQYAPTTAKTLEQLPPQITQNLFVLKTQDGGHAYALRQSGKLIPLTDHQKPQIRCRQTLAKHSDALADLTKPVLVIGLYPGTELIEIFNQAEAKPAPKPQQPLYIGIDSPPVLYAFICSFDITPIIASPRVHFFLTTESKQLTEDIIQSPETPHDFTLISHAPPQVMNQAMPPFVQLTRQRKQATEMMMQTLNAHYNALTNEAIIDRLNNPTQQERPPCIMIPTGNWSTVTQYSAQAIKQTFERQGWQVIHINLAHRLTPYYLATLLLQHKPDLFIFINHLRTEAYAAYPERLLWITWVQDSVHNINNSAIATSWNQATQKHPDRNFIIGYINQIRPYGYRPEALIHMPMTIDEATFTPNVTIAHPSTTDCEIIFASHANNSSQQQLEFLAQHIPVPAPSDSLETLHDQLWNTYRQGNSITSFDDMHAYLQQDENRYGWITQALPDVRDTIIRMLFLKLNDTIYRHIILHWIAEFARQNPAIKLKLYGRGWEQHPDFSPYACGEIQHGTELAKAFNQATLCLHLNAFESGHQRYLEILAAGGQPLCRLAPQRRWPESLKYAFRCLYDQKPLPPENAAVLNEWYFHKYQRNDIPGLKPEASAPHIGQRLDTQLPFLMQRQIQWMRNDRGEPRIFSSKDELFAILQPYTTPKNNTK